MAFLKKEVASQLEAQLGKNTLKTPIGMDILKQAMEQVNSSIEEKLRGQLEAQLGAEFFKTQEGQDIFQQLSASMSP